jgi:hypothetical protein
MPVFSQCLLLSQEADPPSIPQGKPGGYRSHNRGYGQFASNVSRRRWNASRYPLGPKLSI